MGSIIYFCLDRFEQSTEFAHNNGIRELYLDVTGIKLCFIDNKLDAYIFDPIDETAIAVPDCPDNMDGVLWDQNLDERNVFAIYNKSIIATYVFTTKYFVESKRLNVYFIIIVPYKTLYIYI